jgi:TPR repeat protein
MNCHIQTLTIAHCVEKLMTDDGIKLTEQDIEKAKGKDKEILHHIGETYYHLRKYTKAFPWFYKAAVQHHGRAQNRLGNMYQKGYGVSGDYKLAMKWYKRAASNGIPEAMNTIGSLYRIGCGVSESDRQAAKWFMKAAKHENTDAMNNIAHLYEFGYGVSKSASTAVKWYTRAANHGSAKAQYHLGLTYESHDKIRDLQKAVEWYQKASIHKYKDAEKKMKELNEKGYYTKEAQTGTIVIWCYILTIMSNMVSRKKNTSD